MTWAFYDNISIIHVPFKVTNTHRGEFVTFGLNGGLYCTHKNRFDFISPSGLLRLRKIPRAYSTIIETPYCDKQPFQTQILPCEFNAIMNVSSWDENVSLVSPMLFARDFRRRYAKFWTWKLCAMLMKMSWFPASDAIQPTKLKCGYFRNVNSMNSSEIPRL